MSAPTSSNRVHSYLIWSSQSKSNKFQEYLFGSDIRLVKSSANRLDAVYSLDKDKPTLFLQVFKPLLQSAFMGYDSSIILSGLEDTIMSLLLKGSVMLESLKLA